MPEKASMKKCYIYTRVSTAMQVDGYSLAAQKETLEAAAKFKQLRPAGYFTDEGKSGKSINGRDGFRAMMKAIQEGKDGVSYVLVFKLSRFGRNAADIMNSLEFMQSYGVNLYCADEGIDSAGPAGKLIINVLASVAEIERENIHEQTLAGRREKAREGRWNGGMAPFGYRLDYSDGPGKAKLAVDEDRAAIVRLIFEKYTGGQGLNSVANWLNKRGYRFSGPDGAEKLFDMYRVERILDNPVYMGKIAYGRTRAEQIPGKKGASRRVKAGEGEYTLYDGQHEALVSEDLWYKAHAKRKLNSYQREKVYDPDHEHVLSGIVRCPVCGERMYGHIDRKKKPDGSFYTNMPYYVCRRKTLVDGLPCTFRTHVRQDELNNEMFAIFKAAFNSKDFIDRVMEGAGVIGDTKELQADLERQQEAKKKTEKRKAALLSKIYALDPDDSQYDSMYEDLQGIVRKYTEEIAELDKAAAETQVKIDTFSQHKFSAEMYRRMLEMMMENFETVPMDAQRRIIRGLVEKIEIFPERTGNGRWIRSVTFRIPLNLNGTVSKEFSIEDSEEDPFDSGEEDVAGDFPPLTYARRGRGSSEAGRQLRPGIQTGLQLRIAAFG